MRHIITNEERGHRPALYKDGPTVPYTVQVRAKTKARLREVGTARVRRLLDGFALCPECDGPLAEGYCSHCRGAG